MLINKMRIDCILVWGHGIQYLEQILQMIAEDNLEILKIQKFKARNMTKFVKDIYSFDYAPFAHLKEKTKYLLKTQKLVCFIFIRNLTPNEDYIGDGLFRHKESLTIKSIKEQIRDRFNPQINGTRRSEHHVVHATDSIEQTDYLLRYLGYKEGICIFNENHTFLNTSHYIKNDGDLTIKKIPVNLLRCNIIKGRSWDEFVLECNRVEDSPHYKGLTENISLYEEYIMKYIGGPLKDNYNSQKFLNIYNNFKYLKPPFERNYIVVRKNHNFYLILDGLHRASIHLAQKNKDILVCQLK